MLTVLRRRKDLLRLLERQSSLAVLAADLLQSLIDDVGQARARAQAVTALAHDGHNLARDLVLSRRSLWRTRTDGEELDALARGVDAVLDALREAADAVVAERGEPTAACRALADVITKSVAAMHEAIRALPHRDPALNDHLVEVNRLEHLADALLLEAVGTLRSEEADGFAILRWTDIYERLESVTNRGQTVAAIVEQIAARRT
jgi:uncharacterized protein Yka (UPF0111/DUF47 family)